MENTQLLGLPYILASQAQKHVTHNEALRMLDAVIHLHVLSSSISQPPADPVEGDRYIVPDGSEDWDGSDGSVMAFQDGAWAAFSPQAGWLAWIADEQSLQVFRDGGWQSVSRDLVDKFGIRTAADDENRLAVASNSVLLTHDGAGHRLKINKAADTETASVLFQTGYSGRAEFGTTGSDNFSLKVSENGSDWKDALTVDPQSGEVSMPFSSFGNGGASGFVAGPVSQLDTGQKLYIDSINGDDDNDGLSVATALASLRGLAKRLDIGRRVIVSLLSDLECDFVVAASYPIEKLTIQGRNDTNTAYQERTLNIVNSTNWATYPGGLLLRCMSNIYLRSLRIDLISTRARPFITFYSTMGYLRTYDVRLARPATGAAVLFGQSNSFIPNQHLSFTIEPEAEGYVAQGVAAGQNPNSKWNYPSNQTRF